MTLTVFVNLIKNNARWFVLVVLVLVLGGFLANQLLKPRGIKPVQLKRIEPAQKLKYTVQNIVFSGQWPDFPKEIQQFEVLADTNEILAKVEAVVSKLGFAGSPEKTLVGTEYESWSWANDNRLTFFPNERRLRFSLNVSINRTVLFQGEIPKLDEASVRAEKILKDLELYSPDLVLDKDAVRFLTGAPTGLDPIISQSEGNIIELVYNYRIGNAQVIGQAPTIPFVKIQLGRDYRLFQLDFAFVKKHVSREKQKILSKDQTLAALNSGLGTVMLFEAQKPKGALPKSYEISRVNLKTVSLVLLQNRAFQLFLEPIFVFEGEGVLTSGEKGRVIIYLPATEIKSENQ